MTDARLHSVACERNREPILAVLREVLPTTAHVLEIASGTGMHAAHFARRMPQWQWQPTDPDEAALASIDAWAAEVGSPPNLRNAVRLDVEARPWPIARADAMFNANMIHISPWSCALALFEGASDVLPAGGPLVLYGPYMRDGVHTAPSNEAFDRSLKARDSRWGVRDLAIVERVAEMRGFALERVVEMPANNLSVVFRRQT